MLCLDDIIREAPQMARDRDATGGFAHRLLDPAGFDPDAFDKSHLGEFERIIIDPHDQPYASQLATI